MRGTRHGRIPIVESETERTSQSHVAQLLAQALNEHEAGRIGEAQKLYQKILQCDPKNAGALHYLGLAAHQTGDQALAISLMMQALERDPTRVDFYLNLARVLEQNGLLDRAISCYRQAVALDGDSEIANLQLGFTLLKADQPHQAANSFSQVLRIRPESPEGSNGLGNALEQLGHLEQSIVCYRKAISLDPASVAGHNNLGNVLQQLGRIEEAVACYHRALFYQPDHAEVLSNLGVSLRSRGDLESAVQCLRGAIALRPDFAQAYVNLANAYKELGLLHDSISSYRKAIALRPQNALAYCNMADSLMEQDKTGEAITNLQKAISLGSENNTAYSNLLFLYSATHLISPEAEREFARGWEKCLLTDTERSAARDRASCRSGTFAVQTCPGRKLRVGVVSAELGAHAVAVFLQPFLDQLDHTRIHLTLFPTVTRTGALAQHFQAIADSYLSLVGVQDKDAAARIRAEQIDILLDTTGHTYNCRLGIFAHRAAPVQCSYIGYWSTTGLTEMDWYITDENYSRGCDSHFTERLWRLPHVAHCYKGNELLPQSAWSPDPQGTIWLGSLNKYNKVRSETLKLWAKVMRKLPQAKLLLKDRASHDAETHERILATLCRHGVLEDRVVFLPPNHGGGFAAHMEIHDRLDIALDTIPFNSGTTAFDALWMGVPLVAMEGSRVCGRMGASIVTALGRPEWVAKTEEEYILIVCALANDVEGRKELRSRLRALMIDSQLCDGRGLARSLENAFYAMHGLWLGTP